MTRVGQIFVLLITCLSLLFMGFSITVFSTQRNWKEDLATANADLAKLNKEKGELNDRVTLLRTSLDNEVEKHRNDVVTYQQEQEEFQKNYDSLLQRYNQAVIERARLEQRSKDALAEVSARREEIMKQDVGLRDQLERIRKEREVAVKKQFEAEQDKIETDSQLEIAQSHNQQLNEQVAKLKGILQSNNLPTEVSEYAAINTVPPMVEGVVSEVDSQNRYIKISLGSDDGLRRGHQLDLYRIKPDSRYLGKVEVTEVDPDRAVGRLMPEFKRGNIQEGDLVATRIIPK